MRSPAVGEFPTMSDAPCGRNPPLRRHSASSGNEARAADFISDSNPKDSADFWDAQLSRVSGMGSSIDEHQSQWGAAILTAVKPDAWKVRTLALRHLASRCRMGCSRWMDQFATGFPITGALSQKGVFDLAQPGETALYRALPLRTAESRLRERAAKSGVKHAALLWADAMEQVEKGRLCAPVDLDASGRPAGFHPRGCNVASRFAAEQAE